MALIATPLGVVISAIVLIPDGHWYLILGDVLVFGWLAAVPYILKNRPQAMGPAIVLPMMALTMVFYVQLGPAVPRPVWMAVVVALAAVFLEWKGVLGSSLVLTAFLAFLYFGGTPSLPAWQETLAQPWTSRLHELGIITILSLAIGILMSLFARDLRLQLEETAKNREQYRLLADNAGDMIWTMSLDLQFTYVSPSSLRLLGYSPEEMVALPLEATTHPESMERIRQLLRDRFDLYEQGDSDFAEPVVFDVDVVRKDGQVIPTRVHARIVTGENGRPSSIVGVTRDVSESKHFENLMRAQRDLAIAVTEATDKDSLLRLCLEAAISSAKMDWGAMVMADELSQGLRIQVSSHMTGELHSLVERLADEPRILEMTRTGRKTYLNRREIHDFFPDNPCPQGVTTLALLPLESNGTFVGVLCAGYSQETAIPKYQWEALETMVSQIGTHLARFFSEEQLAESEGTRKRLEIELFQAHKMEAIGRLAGGLAHDFNNILCAISGLTDIILTDQDPAPPIARNVQEISDAATKAADLTAQLLAFSRKQVIQPRPVNLNDRVQSILSMVQRLLGENITVETRLAPNLSPIKVDPGQIDQVLMNLAVNSRDAMPEGGRLTLATEERELDEAFCSRHRGFHPERHVILTIEDTGSGIPPEIIDKVFEPFFTTKEVGSGTGLGLATVLGIVEQNGGHIHVQSMPGRGTKFTLFFPASAETVEPQPAGESTSRATPGNQGGETILVVEDDPLVQKVVVSLLTRLGYEVLVASGGAEALEITRDHPGPIHLLFTDVVMPDTNGRELAATLQKRFPDMAVLFTSGYNRAIIAHHGVLEEGIEFIPKPYRIQELGEKVRSVLDKRAPEQNRAQNDLA